MLSAQTKITYKPYAMTDALSKGRKTIDDFPQGDFRSEFQHDRDRIIHSKAFRRLESKTQVIYSQDSDHTRTRLTHSIEVMQISDSIAYSLGANIFLTQAIALGHDLGHAPFGHSGEEALNEILTNHGLKGFKHNFQSLLIVDKLERSYRDVDGLNLMYETRDGILRHTKTLDIKKDISINDYDKNLNMKREYPITLEGQIVRIADEIAQRTHDTDDALRTDRITIYELLKQSVMKKVLKYNKFTPAKIKSLYEQDKGKTISKIIGFMIKFYIKEILMNTFKNIEERKIKTYRDILLNDIQLVSFNASFTSEDEIFKKEFLSQRFYDNHEIKRMDSRGSFFIKQLFKAFKKTPGQLAENIFNDFKSAVKNDLTRHKLKIENHECYNKGCTYNYKIVAGTHHKHIFTCPLQKKNKSACGGIRVIVNYIAGMTDRHANVEYTRLYLPPEH